MTVASFIGFTGFTLVMPFLPLYFRELGLTDVRDIVFWSGLSLGVTPALTAVLAPTWGRVADRFGRKIMVERSLLSFVLIMGATAYITKPWHLLALRIVQGFFAGYGALILSMVAASAPRGRMAPAIGRVQIAQRLGPALGPVVGGVLAQLIGLRRTFLVAAGFYAAAFVLVLFMYREPRRVKTQDARDATRPVSFRNVLAFQNFLLLMGVIFGIQYVDRSFGPVLPLYIAQLGVPLDRVPLVSGVLFSIGAGTGALGHQVTSGVLSKVSARVVLAGGAGLAAAAAAVFAAAPSVGTLLMAMPVFGLAAGVGLTGAYTAAGGVIPSGAHSTGFGFLASASLSAFALSPIVSGFLGATSIRAVFVLDALALVAVAALVSRVMVERSLKAEVPRVEDV